MAINLRYRMSPLFDWAIKLGMGLGVSIVLIPGLTFVLSGDWYPLSVIFFPILLINASLIGGAAALLLYPLTWYLLRYKSPRSVRWHVGAPAFVCGLLSSCILLQEEDGLLIWTAGTALACYLILCFVANARLPDVTGPNVDPNICSNCGYIVAHCKSDRCPECGEPIAPRPQEPGDEND